MPVSDPLTYLSQILDMITKGVEVSIPKLDECCSLYPGVWLNNSCENMKKESNSSETKDETFCSSPPN